MNEGLSPEEKAYLRFVQLRDEIKTLINNEIAKSAEATQRQEDAITKFIAHFEDFAKIAENVEKQIGETITQSATLTADLASKQLTELVKQDVAAIVDGETATLQTELITVLNDLRIGVTQATNTLNGQRLRLTKTGYLVAGTLCVSSLLVAFGIHYLFPRTTTHQLNDTMARAYFVGERIINNWSKLSDKEKDKILSLTVTKS